MADLGLALIIAGVYSFKAWLNAKTEQRKLEIEDQAKKSWLDAHKVSVENDSAKLEILAKAMARQPILLEVEASVDGARQQIIKAVSEERGGSISGVPIDADFGSEIVSQKRQPSQEIRLAGTYRVSRVDTTAPDGFKVTLTDIQSGQEVTAAMTDVLLSEDQREIIQTAEWHKQPVFVEMTARKLRNRVVDAIIQNVRKHVLTGTQSHQISD